MTRATRRTPRRSREPALGPEPFVPRRRAYTPIDVLSDDAVRDFVGEYQPDVFALQDGVEATWGGLDFNDYFYEHKRQQVEAMADDHHLMDCFECGSCSFVCPSHIPLVQQFRAAKAAVRRTRAA